MARGENRFRSSCSARRTPERGRRQSGPPRACATPPASCRLPPSSRDLERRGRRSLQCLGRNGNRRRFRETHLLILDGANAGGKGEQPNESSRIAPLVDVVLAERDETLIVQRV